MEQAVKLFACALLWLPLPLLSAPVLKATTHRVTLKWKASPDGGKVGIHRAKGRCGAAGIHYTLLTAAAPVGGPYVDNVTGGQWYCYYVDARVNGKVSQPSNRAGLLVPK